MEFKFTKSSIIVIVVFLTVVIIGLKLYDYRNPKPMKEEKTKIKLVENYGRFFTISNAGNKYISYINKEEKNNLMLVLSDNYISLNGITKENVLKKLPKLNFNNDYSFEARKMYDEEINENITRYYLYGFLNENLIDGHSKSTDYYLIVDLDIINNTFEITPYDGKIFKEDL